MAASNDTPPDPDKLARVVFFATTFGVLAFVGAVIVYVL